MARKETMVKKPEPISKHVVCSECGQPWDKHGDKPTLETCVKLLKAELAKPRPYAMQIAGSMAQPPWGNYTVS